MALPVINRFKTTALSLSLLNGFTVRHGFLVLGLAISLPIAALTTSPAAWGQSLVGSTIVQPDNSAKARLKNLIKDYEAFLRDSDPFYAADQGDRSALRQLPDISLESLNNRAKLLTDFVARHAALPRTGLDKQERLTLELLGFTLKQRQRLIPFDEARIPFTNDSGFYNILPFIMRQTEFSSSDDYEAYTARLTQLPRFFSQHKTNMRRGLATNVTANQQILSGIITQVDNYSSGKAKDHILFTPFTNFPDNLDKSEQKRLRALGVAAIKSAVIPAYKDLGKFLKEDYQPKARQDDGIGTHAEARAYYRALTKYFTTLDMSPDEIHALGLSEVARIRAQMDEIISETGFDGDFKAFVAFLRSDPQFYAKTEDELLMRAAWIAKQIDGQMPQFFKTLPRLSYGVMAVPENIAKNYTTGRYWGGNPDAGRAGNYLVNTYDLSQRPLYNLPALTAHEGVPGHHHQIALSQELKNLPQFRRRLYPNAFGEGWGLYAEKLAADMGIYKTPYERFGQLTYEMWRACRLVVDTGLHWLGWDRAKAEACFYENSALSEHNIKTELDRYISWPGQALSYKIGELKILELRKRAQDALGDDFDIGLFHDAVLENGGMPLDLLEAQIRQFIFSQRQIIEKNRRADQSPQPISNEN